MTWSTREVDVTSAESVRLDVDDPTTGRIDPQTVQITPSVDVRVGPTSDVAASGEDIGSLVEAEGVFTIRLPAGDELWAIAVSTSGTIDVKQVDS